MEQQQDAQVPPHSGITTHEELILNYVHSWKLFLSDAPGGALILTLTFSFIFNPSVPLAPLPTIWPLVHGDSEPPHGRKSTTERRDQTRKLFRGGGQIVLTIK